MKKTKKQRQRTKPLIPKVSFLSDEGYILLEYNHFMKTSECLYRSGVNLDDKQQCRIILTAEYFHPWVIDRHLERSIEWAQKKRDE